MEIHLRMEWTKEGEKKSLRMENVTATFKKGKKEDLWTS